MTQLKGVFNFEVKVKVFHVMLEKMRQKLTVNVEVVFLT